MGARRVWKESSDRSQRIGASFSASLRMALLAFSTLAGLIWLAIPAMAVDSTSLTLTLNPTTVCAGDSVTCTVTVTNTAGTPEFGTPQGTVSFSSDGHGSFSYVTRTLSGGSCTTTYYPSSAEGSPHTISASYVPSPSNWNTSSQDKNLTVNWCVEVNVMGSDTPLIVGNTATVEVTVTDTSGSGAIPTGTVYFSDDAGSYGTFDHSSRTLDPAGHCTVEYTVHGMDGTDDVHRITANYGGDWNYSSADSYFDQGIVKRDADLTVTLNPTTAYVRQDVTVMVHVEDDTTDGVPGTLSGVEITLDDDGKNGTFADDTPTLDASGNCTVTYTPEAWDEGTTTITATLANSEVYTDNVASELLTVVLRPTRTIVEGTTDTLLVNQGWTYDVTVEDIAEGVTAISPSGDVRFSSYLDTDAVLSPDSGTASSDTFVYTCVGLDAEAGIDTIYADYEADDGIHADSSGLYGQGIQRRPTITSISGSSTPTGVSYSVTVQEDPDNAGLDGILQGDVHLLEPDETPCTGLIGLTLVCGGTITSTSPLVNVSVEYLPTDRVHLSSTDSENIDRSDQFDPNDGDDGTTGANCDDGCGAGGIDIDQMIFDLNAADVALAAVQMGLEVASIAIDLIPDGVVTAGIVVQTGVTIPYSDIAAAIVSGSALAIEIARTAMTTDLDGDGLPDVVENTVTDTDYDNVDTDGDGMGDYDEISWAGGYYGGSRRPDPNVYDTDGDGLSDGDEVYTYGTSPCVADTDCDTISDGDEVATWSDADARNHSDPLVMDTDGDGLTDDLEIDPGCTFVNDDDSDDDGLQDGYEDTNRDGTITQTLGGAISQGSGETSVCAADSDGDGLLDGEEEGLFGQGACNALSPLGTVTTTPALDDDSDDDGLSDYEEQVVTHTDPLNWDSDGDSLSDANEMLALTGAWPMRTFAQVSDPLDPDTDDDGLRDDIEYTGTGLRTTQGLGGSGDNICPFVNDDDSDDDGLQDGAESWDGNGTITLGIMGDSTTQSQINPSGETDFCNPDTDGDGLTDGEEVALLGGLLIDGVSGFTPVIAEGVSTTFGAAGAPLVGTVPPLDDDSDNDGLSDYEELVVTGTDPLDQDSDNDTLSDADELIAIAGTWPNRSFIQVSDPLDPDTDDDDIPDQNEYPGSGLGTSRGLGGAPDTDCPYVNDDDSDNDGLQDGVEDANHDGTWGEAGVGITIGSFGTQSSKTVTYWETDPCNPDTDGDGIRDGEEANLIGGGPTGGRPVIAPGFSTVIPEGCSTVTPVGPDYSGGPLFTFAPASGAAIGATVPALDVDSDNDGLSDYEEVMVTGTDPLDADSDNDTLMDADELIATGGISGLTPQRTFDQESDPLDINTDDDHLYDPVEGECGDVVNHGTGVAALAGGIGGVRDMTCPYINDDDSDNDGVQDGAVIPILRQGPGISYSYIFFEGFADVPAADIQAPGTVRVVVTAATGEQDDDALCNVCDADSDGDGLMDGEEVGLGTDPQDWDTDDDGRNDWHEMTGGGPIPTDPFDPDTDDDGLLDSAEVFGANATNPVNADTDGDGLCDGGAGTPYMTSGHPTVIVNPICKSCSQPGNVSCGTSIRTGSPDGIGDHPNPMGLGEDENGNGNWDVGETDPNQYDTDGDADGDGIEKLGFSTSRQSAIPSTDMLGQAIRVAYPECGCLDPLDPDTDGDGISDGVEDLNHDGNFDFNPSDFDFQDLLDGAPQSDPEETNPCNPDTDDDGLTDYFERNQTNPSVFYPYNPTNPLDHDTDNDYLFDGEEVNWPCIDPGFNLDPNLDGIADYFVMTVLGDVLDPTNRDSDSDGFIDGLDPNPCYSWLIPIGKTLDDELTDEDGDGFCDADELAAGTDPHDADDHPLVFVDDFDRDLDLDDVLWLEDVNGDGMADSVAIDLDDDATVDARIRLVLLRDMRLGDFDEDGDADDVRIIIEYAFSNGRYLHPRTILTITDLDSDFVIDAVSFAP